jgi:hypothetical protein
MSPAPAAIATRVSPGDRGGRDVRLERMWLPRDYLPEVAEQDRRDVPSMAQLADWLGPGTRVEVVPISRTTPDWTFALLLAHPERVLDERVTTGTSGFARLDPAVRRRAVGAVRRDLQDGSWDARHGHLRELESYDAGLRLVVHDAERPVA